MTAETFRWQSDGVNDVVQRHPRGAAMLSVIEPTAKPPDDAMRRASVKMVEALGSRLSCVGLVIEGEGFLAAVNRGVVTGMILLASKLRTPVAVFPNTSQAASWMRRFLVVPPNDEFTACVESVRAQIPAT